LFGAVFGIPSPGPALKCECTTRLGAEYRYILGRELTPATRFPIQTPGSAIEFQIRNNGYESKDRSAECCRRINLEIAFLSFVVRTTFEVTT
jgi:hypothetical protein